MLPQNAQQRLPQQRNAAIPTVLHQMSTTNRSFLEMHYYLKKIGIENNKFMLTLLDPDLAGIDPHDKNLSITMKAKVTREVKYNYWYYLREVVRIPTSGVANGSKYQLHRGNLALNFCLMYNLNIFFELPRQQGKSISAVVWYLHVYNFGTSNSEITFLNKAMKDSKLNLQRLKDIRDALPSYLRMDQPYSISGDKKLKMPSTVETIQHPINKNLVKTAPSARNAIAAANLLRGRTIPLLWADEWAFIPYNDIIFINTIPAFKTAALNAKNAGSPFGILLSTTPGILTTPEGKEAYRMIQGAVNFTERWYNLRYDQIMGIINANSSSNFVYIKFTYKQVGRDEKWFEDICKEMEWKWNEIRREILLEWSDSPENSPFNKEDLETVGRLVHERIDEKLILGKYTLNIYERIPLKSDYTPKYPPIMGVDVSGGYKQDASAITIIDSRTTKVFADFKCNYISPIDLARVVYEITTTMMPNVVINVERNGGFGASVLAKLIESKVKKNLYYEIKDRVIEEQNDGIRIIRKKQKTKVFGFDSSKGSRDLLIEILRERMERHKDKFISPVLHKELNGMQVKRSGRVEHSDTSHDDQVFSYLMALYVWYEGKNLKELFNIEKCSIKTEADIDENVDGLEEKFSSIIEEIEYIGNEKQEEVNKELAEMKAAAGVMLNEWKLKEAEKENNMLRIMLQNRAVKEAYARQNNCSVFDLESNLGIDSGIPDSVFTSFNSDDDEDYKKMMDENFNFRV
jgi:hypothetical protein